MRAKTDPQKSIFELYSDHTIGRELQAISDRLERHMEILDWVAEDLGWSKKRATGRRGLTVENIFRAGLLMQRTGFSYRELEFYLDDSLTFRAFTRLSGKHPDFCTLQRNISAIGEETWERINCYLMVSVAREGIEKGRVIRTDSTVTETHIHKPLDSVLLWDSVRVMTRLLDQAEAIMEKRLVPFRDHQRVSKKLQNHIIYARSMKQRVPFYKRLLKYTHMTKDYLVQTVAAITSPLSSLPAIIDWKNQAIHYLELIDKVIDQTQRRVLHGESVPSQEKIVSLFEEHTDIIVKGRREVLYGHKINLTTGRSGLVLDLVIEEGNPADSTRTLPMIQRQVEIFGRPPRQASFDGCYASKDNVAQAKNLGVSDIAFHKKCGLSIADMVKSDWVYKKLRAFRAGIEANISTLKSQYGFRRCHWKGLAHFKRYLWGSVVAYNLVTLARLDLAAAEAK